MSRIRRDENNIVMIPSGVSVAKSGYVYLNTTSCWIQNLDGSKKHADHKKVCIGIAINPQDWKADRKMYANVEYYNRYPKDLENTTSGFTPYEVYPRRWDTISVGLYAVIKSIAEESGLLDISVDVFGLQNTFVLLDLSMYMLSTESAVFQHFPDWAGRNAIFSSAIYSDSYISKFLKEEITLSQINLFKKKWARHVCKNGRIFVCYDSTNVNSQAEGVFIVQRGHAKDDSSLDQVNTEYAIRQEDGLPITFNEYPGSINDMTEASEMIRFFRELLSDHKASHTTNDGNGDDNDDREDQSSGQLHLSMIADRGYVSADNIINMRSSGIGYLMMLKKNMGIMKTILDEYSPKVKSFDNYDDDSGKFAMTLKSKLFDDDAEDSWFHIVWDAEMEMAHRKDLKRKIRQQEARLQKAVSRKTLMPEIELRHYWEFFNLTVREAGTLKVTGQKKGTTKSVPAYVIESFKMDINSVNTASAQCGYFVFVSDNEMTAWEALNISSKRDCVEKVFQALKSSLGMDKIGVHFESSMHTKSLIWFFAAILHTWIFTATNHLRARNKKKYTVPALVNQFENVRADKDLIDGKYKRRYLLDARQIEALKPFHVDEKMINQVIDDLE